MGSKRPLNVIEMANIYFNLIQNQLGRTLMIGFSQVAHSQKVRNYMVRGRKIADKHVEVFGSLLISLGQSPRRDFLHRIRKIHKEFTN